jgi:plasmid stability protein
MSRRLTIRGVPDDVIARLKNVGRVRGQSMNTTIKQILADAVGPEQRMDRLLRYATWTHADLAEFSEAVAGQRTVDAETWR